MAVANTGANQARRPLRFGVLGAANINKDAIIDPTKKVPGDAVIAAIAARDPARARKYCEKMKLGDVAVFASYEEMLDKADIDCVYNPLPNGLHYEWTLRALRAGKHVLCEKPFASNADEAREMVALAQEKGLVLMEAFHWFYHPFRERMQQIIASGALGEVRGLEADFCIPGPKGPKTAKYKKSMIRYMDSLAGGAMMDLGTYATNAMRVLMGREVPVVNWAEADKWAEDPRIDEGMKGEITFPSSGVKGKFNVTYVAPKGSQFTWNVSVVGSKATMAAVNYGVPHKGNSITVTAAGGAQLSKESVDSGGYSTYDLQLLAFCSHVRQIRSGWVRSTTAFENTGDEPILQMELLDRVYIAAGMRPRTGPAGIKSKL